MSDVDKRVELLEREISELKKMIPPQRKANYWFQKYGEYLYKRLYEYGYSKETKGLSTTYTAIRNIVRLRYVGNSRSVSYQFPSSKEEYEKVCGIVDSILPEVDNPKDLSLTGYIKQKKGEHYVKL